MALKIGKYFRIFFYYKKMNFVERTAYRFGFFLIVFSVFIQIFFNLFFIEIIFSWVNSISGWNHYEALLVVGTIIFLDGLMWITCAFVHILGEQIKLGTLDFTITRPMDAQYLVSIRRGDLEDVVRIATGMGVIIFSLAHLNYFSWGMISNFFWYIVLTMNGFMIIYSIAVMLSSVRFWTIGTSMFSLADSIMRTAQYPSDIFSGKFSHFIFSFVFPLAFMATVPAKILSSGFQWKLVLESFIVAAVFFWISRKIWKIGLSKYSSASS